MRRLPKYTMTALALLSTVSLATACGGGEAGSEAMAMSGEGAAAQAQAPDDTAVAIFAGGCFWCMEPPYDKLDGVFSTISGYTGGQVVDPSYQQVSSGGTGHYEAVKIEYDPERIGYDSLLYVFWRNIDPTDAGGQFCDRGDQYRSAIFYLDEKQRELAEESKRKLEAAERPSEPIVTEILPAEEFYPAEEYHQDYYQKNSIRYKFYRTSCGRDRVLRHIWGEEAPE